MDDRYTIVAARLRDLPALAAIELAAATLLEGQAPPSVLNEITDQSDLRGAQAKGRVRASNRGEGAPQV